MKDVLVVEKGLDKKESRQRKGELDRIAALLSRLGGRCNRAKEGLEFYVRTEFDPDGDPDGDLDKLEP